MKISDLNLNGNLTAEELAVIENQNEKCRISRREGSLRLGIAEYLQQNKGEGTRQGILDYLQDVLGLTEAERRAIHETENTKRNNYFESYVDWEADDMRKVGTLEPSETRDGNWKLVKHPLDEEDLKRIHIQGQITHQKKEKGFEEQKKKEILAYSRLTLSSKDRKTVMNHFRKVRRSINDRYVDYIYDSVMDNYLSVPEAVNQFWKEAE
jgi:DNA-binding cell septation regulator SpoVG